MSRRPIFALLATGAVALSGCGSTAHFADRNRPPTPVDLTVYINDAKVSVSPASVGAGPVIFYVTNQASRTESLIVRSAAGRSLANTGPINPRSTAQVQVDFRQGSYRLTTSSATPSDAASLTAPPVAPATLRIGAPRPNADNALLQP
ncbi:MAG TPA: hypothetical protein VFP55_10105 [Solirubrobacteraceae bacterium]|nr:hypothetical protein [Solirubrobacteraceae bacterium]